MLGLCERIGIHETLFYVAQNTNWNIKLSRIKILLWANQNSLNFEWLSIFPSVSNYIKTYVYAQKLTHSQVDIFEFWMRSKLANFRAGIQYNYVTVQTFLEAGGLLCSFANHTTLIISDSLLRKKIILVFGSKNVIQRYKPKQYTVYIRLIM